MSKITSKLVHIYVNTVCHFTYAREIYSAKVESFILSSSIKGHLLCFKQTSFYCI